MSANVKPSGIPASWKYCIRRKRSSLVRGVVTLTRFAFRASSTTSLSWSSTKWGSVTSATPVVSAPPAPLTSSHVEMFRGPGASRCVVARPVAGSSWRIVAHGERKS